MEPDIPVGVVAWAQVPVTVPVAGEPPMLVAPTNVAPQVEKSYTYEP
jgi:hypothetical protein